MGDEDIIKASQSGSASDIKESIENGADVNTTAHFKGKTPLILASESGNLEAVKLLLEKGANINAQADSGTFALMRASQSGHLEIAQLLISSGADVNLKGEKDNTALMGACMKGDLPLVKALLAAGADPNATTTGGVTPLMRARNHPDILQLLLENGADDSKMREDGKTVSDLAKAESLDGSLDALGEQSSEKKGGCFIATACYGDYDAPEVLVLRNFRDNYLLKTMIGRILVDVYYYVSPAVSKIILRHNSVKHFVRNIILKPIVHSIKDWR